ncbi:FMN-binding protein [Actinophytocola sp.]|uniref:FMN-binding protein n=1 Tax=Actinophytocola sp. TaxID=1872138 RepID=UPI002D696D25|nr:FMN-binding protein [Actinophytocola sp.]HYQ61748.1 FMN-binding protein [Actinophytocola sp.]
MRKALIILALLFAGLVPLMRYHPATSPAPTAVAAPPAPETGTPTPGTGTQGTRTVDGPVVDTEFGPYQVRVTFSGATITDVQIVTEPGDGHSQRIASRAGPTLRSEALRAQSAHIDMVSGATVTSEAYARSLQAAIDANGG